MLGRRRSQANLSWDELLQWTNEFMCLSVIVGGVFLSHARVFSQNILRALFPRSSAVGVWICPNISNSFATYMFAEVKLQMIMRKSFITQKFWKVVPFPDIILPQKMFNIAQSYVFLLPSHDNASVSKAVDREFNPHTERGFVTTKSTKKFQLPIFFSKSN